MITSCCEVLFVDRNLLEEGRWGRPAKDALAMILWQWSSFLQALDQLFARVFLIVFHRILSCPNEKPLISKYWLLHWSAEWDWAFDFFICMILLIHAALSQRQYTTCRRQFYPRISNWTEIYCLTLTIWIAFPIQIFLKLFSLGFS